MPGEPRSLPDRPSLRYLKVEARRRLGAQEFPALHHAQAAIAREHGLPSWAALKHEIDARGQDGSHALAQLRWIAGRFRDAGRPGWSPPDEAELGQHFDERFLAVLPAAELAAGIAARADDLQGELPVVQAEPLRARVRLSGNDLVVAVEAAPPHRITGLRFLPGAGPAADPRVTRPYPVRSLGPVPPAEAAAAAAAADELGLPGLVLAGGAPGQAPWAAAAGWADLDRGEVLDPARHRLPAPGLCALVAVTAVLRLVADGRLDLDQPVSRWLRAVRLADESVTLREVLSYTSGIGNPDVRQVFGDRVPDLAELAGPVVTWPGTRGVLRPTNGAIAVLGQLIADVTRTGFTEAAAGLVLRPLGLASAHWAAGPGSVTGYQQSADGALVPVPERVYAIPAAAGLWATAADLVRLTAGWSSLLPPGLVAEALSVQATAEQGDGAAGLGWLLIRSGVAALGGAAPGSAAFALLRTADGAVRLTVATTLTPLEAIHDRVLREWTGPAAPARS